VGPVVFGLHVAPGNSLSVWFYSERQAGSKSQPALGMFRSVAAVLRSHTAAGNKRGEGSSINSIEEHPSQARANGSFARCYSNPLTDNGTIVNISAFVTMSTQVRISYHLSSRSENMAAPEKPALEARRREPLSARGPSRAELEIEQHLFYSGHWDGISFNGF
jgi:hypothetical protein